MRTGFITKTSIVAMLALLFLACGVILNGCSNESETSMYNTKSISPADAEKVEMNPFETTKFSTSMVIDSVSDCLNMGLTADTPDIPFNLDCIEWVYDDDETLRIHHANAGFNCCPEISKLLEVRGDTILITEIELSGECDCICLFDIYYKIFHLRAGEYHFKVIEPCVGDQEEQLEFSLDLINEPTGDYCVERNHYPWGE